MFNLPPPVPVVLPDVPDPFFYLAVLVTLVVVGFIGGYCWALLSLGRQESAAERF